MGVSAMESSYVQGVTRCGEEKRPLCRGGLLGGKEGRISASETLLDTITMTHGHESALK